jgi:hypothetical protein
MSVQEKRLKQLEARLKGGNAGVVMDTITSLRSKKPCTGAMKLLSELFNTSENSMVKKHIQNFMNDMKKPSLREELIDEIKKDYKPETVKMLVASCWQSGLDYSSWASDFAMIFSTCDYETAIECFTVLEGCTHLIPRKTRDHIIIILRENEDIKTSNKSTLMLELVSALS